MLSSAEKDPLTEINETIFDEGLSLVDFLIEPHINNKYFPEVTFENAKKQSEKLSKTIYALDDNSAIKVKDNEVLVVSEGDWKKFT